MRIAVAFVVLNVDPFRYADEVEGTWPNDDQRSLTTAVRQDIRGKMLELVKNIPELRSLGIEVDFK